jgi:EmrB/QacA subfamily drug resistance transporter
MNRAALRLIGSIALGNALVPLNSTMLVVALPAIARDFHASVADTAWLITTYLIAMAALQPIGGRLGDRFGRRKLMLAALAYFGLASIGAALSSGLVMLAFFRLQQAVAGAIITPNGLGMLRYAAGNRAGVQFGVMGTISGLAASSGPLIGSFLVPIDWRLTFGINIPIVVLALILATANLPEEADRARSKARFDIVGVVALGLLLVGTAWVLTSLGRGGPDALAIGIAVAVVIGFVAFMRYENAREDPALPPSLFLIRSFTAANVAMCFSNLALYATLLALPILLADREPILVGVSLFALSAAAVVLGPIAGALLDKYGARWPTMLGGVLIVSGSIATGLVVTNAELVALLLSVLVLGSGVAFTFPATRLAALDVVPARHAALATGVVSTSRYFGGMLGAIAASVSVTAFAHDVRGPVLFGVLAASGLVTALASLGMPGTAHTQAVVSAELGPGG